MQFVCGIRFHEFLPAGLESAPDRFGLMMSSVALLLLNPTSSVAPTMVSVYTTVATQRTFQSPVPTQGLVIVSLISVNTVASKSHLGHLYRHSG